MAELKLPDLGDNVTSAVVVGVLIKEGDTVEAGQPVLELETDKAVMEAPASEGGTVSKVMVKPGDEVKSGQVIAVLGSATPSAETSKPAPATPPPPTPATPPPAPASAQPASTPSAAQPPSVPAPPRSAASLPSAPAGQRRLIPAAPSVRRLAREMGVNLLEVVGSGPAYRISESDVKRFASGEARCSRLPPSPRARLLQCCPTSASLVRCAARPCRASAGQLCAAWPRPGAPSRW